MRTQEFPFSEGDYLPRVQQLQRALDRAKADAERGASSRTMLEADPVEEIETELEALAVEHLAAMREAKRYVVLTSVGRTAWRELKKKYPPRKEGAEDDDLPFLDDSYGIHLEAAQDELVRASLVEPTFDSGEAFSEWADSTIAPGEWAALVLGAANLALGVVADPKLLPGSRTLSTEPS